MDSRKQPGEALKRFALIMAIGIALLVAVWSGDRELIEQDQDAARELRVASEAPSPLVDSQSAEVSAPQESKLNRLPENTRDPPIASLDSGSAPIHTWSEPPEDIASRIQTELLAERFGVVWDVGVTCSQTKCDVRYSRSRGSINLTSSFVDFVRGAPINAMGVSVSWDANSDGTYTYHHEVFTFRETPPEDYRGLGMTAAELDQFGQRFLSLFDIYASPVVLEMRDDITLVVENICSTDCPQDLRQVLHWRSSEGRPCEELGSGIAELFLIRGADGSFEERTLCVEHPYE
jgi:hypothetical protein